MRSLVPCLGLAILLGVGCTSSTDPPGAPSTSSTSGGDAGPDGSAALAITPHRATVAQKGSAKLTCNLPCTFAVNEGPAGGSIATDGTYTAPAATGVFHVVATSADAQTDTATITVPPIATGTPGQWENVTAPEMPASLFTGSGGFGVGNIVQDPKRPTDMFAGGYGSTWKSTDYGLHWTEVKSNPVPPYGPLGHVLAIADDDGTTATLWNAAPIGAQKVYRSTDAGLTFALTGTLSGGPDASLYSIVVDPNDSRHLLSGFHEADGLAESTDGGDTWSYVSRTGWPTGGISWFPFFLDTGDAKTTRTTWLAIAQNGGSLCITRDGGAGAHWSIPSGASGLNHPHGNSGIFQMGGTLFVGGTHSDGATSAGDGVYKSVDLGASWMQVSNHAAGVVFGSSKNVYAMWSWACAQCTWDNVDLQYLVAPQPGTTWSGGAKAANGLNWGPNSVAATSDGTHAIYVGSMWSSGLWRYVEP